MTINPDLSLSAYDYELPPERIAQNPAVPRDSSRLLLVDRSRQHSDCYFYQLPQFLREGDLLILNNTKVLPARLYGQKPSGVKVEILLVEPRGLNRWMALVRPGKRLPVGSRIIFAEDVKASVVAIDPATRGRELVFQIPEGKTFEEVIEQLGHIPLPPYITESASTPEQYQTIYAEHLGAIAAPTAGLHFTEELFSKLNAAGVKQSYITLHVGVGTFRPVEVEDVTTHKMHEEWFEVSEAVIAAIKETKANGGRVIGVGTTVARALESSKFHPYKGKTDLMIYPGYEWQVLDGLITNFHLPKSSLMMLVSSFLGEGGREQLLKLYKHAIAQEYRFYSFGDAMMIWRNP